MVNIKVAVRIRPLSERELLNGEEIIVRRENNSVLVTNPKIPVRHDGDSRQRTKRFVVDFCYDPKNSENCTQEAVYKEIGSEVLDSMFEGYNACVMAYGHSASGKTYTIMGLQNDPGLTPRLCEGLFEKLDGKCLEEKIRVQVLISFLEIYNEKVRDLLGSEETPANFSLRVREHPKLGPYVQGLTEHSVTDKRKLLGLLERGNKRRSTAATENNVHSSRSHAVFTILFKQSDGENYETEKCSKVHLVDLAGSLQEVSKKETDERASSSQSKARLKEGANINKSLVTLGNVISALAESYESGIFLKEHNKTWQPFVPYRDSVLTWLLKDTLGGNSNTIMIATVSSASGCISETVNTLRYAKRTKRIVNQPIINEDPKVRTIRQLKEEISRLRRMLFSFQSCGSWWDSGENSFGFPSPESKWLDTGGTRITVTPRSSKKRKTPEEKGIEEEVEEDGGEEEATENSNEEKRKRKKLGNSDWNECKVGVNREEAGHTKADACKIIHENESGVNESVNDNFSHETQIFSDSLESFSSVLSKARDSGDDEFGPMDLAKNSKENPLLNSLENWSAMLHRSRPDLIKGISTRSKDSLPSGSCTDVSNLSQSTSENSLNSSGSVDVQSSERKGNEATVVKKKEKRSEIVDAVTSRLYVTKKKPETPKKDAEELDESKLCKRARMKLFDLSRKLAMTRKTKKTVDTQTESGTLRVKEKSVTTDLSLVASDLKTSEGALTEGKEKKPCVIMNQVFIPRSSNCVVECGNVVRIETPDTRLESATQTGLEGKTYKNANTSPIKLSPRDEDSFSDDSLDLQDKTCNREDKTSKQNAWTQVSNEASKPKQSLLYLGERISLDEEMAFIAAEVSGLGLKREGNSSENSFTSGDGTDVSCFSETSSEDFIFYENPKDLELKTKSTSDRELYTITENSEQSDPSDAFSPVQSFVGVESDTNVREPCHSSEGKPVWDGGKTNQLSENVKVPKPVSLPSPSIGKFEQVPNTKKADSKTTWANRSSNSQNQYLNLNISSSRPFSVDTPLFEGVSKKDESTETMFNSVDSITFFFMGPAKPKTSVLMEIIKRSLGKSSPPDGQTKSKNKGIQCDPSLLRSVSVDTAMMALSRIAKNQETASYTQRTTSLGALNPQETLAGFEKGKLQLQRGTNPVSDDYFKLEKKKSALKCLVPTKTAPKNDKKPAEKPKKSVSWSGETTNSEKEHEPVFDLNYQDFPELESEDSNEGRLTPEPEFLEKRVRFKQKPDSSDKLTAFLKEATQLLRNVNSRSSLYSQEFGENSIKKEENESITRSETESCLKKTGSWRSRKPDESNSNATWPRRRPCTGKPPTGLKPRCSRSPLLSRSDSPNWSQSIRTGSWDLSNLSVALSNSCIEESQIRSPVSGESRCSRSSSLAHPRSSTLNFDSLLELEADLEESCRRLEAAAEEDRIREKLWGEAEWRKKVIKRRKPEECAGGCTCDPSKTDPCKHLWSRSCGSSFELDSFGPGTTHCHQRCMFCRKKEIESYYSALNLNSECSSGLCRLNHYGFCPCSSVRLTHVASSPRAYMHHLLALRRRIVGRTKGDHEGGVTCRRSSPRLY